MSRAEIMVVEDEGLVALEIKESLQSMGYHVPGIFSNGHDAIESIMSDRPDLVLMDIRLEGEMDGIETARQIKESFSIPVVFLTAHSDEATIQKARESESYGYLFKPFEDRALKAAIEIALYKNKQENALKGSNEWLSIILRCIDEGIVVTDIKGYIKFLNDKAAEILGIAQIDAIGKRSQAILPMTDPETQEALMLPLSDVLFEGTIINKPHVWLTDVQGNRKDLRFTLAPLRNDNGLTIGCLFVFKESQQLTKFEIFEKDELQKPVKLQKNLLPNNGMSLGGIQLHWFFYPSVYGSGDIFNFFKLDDDHVGFYLLDVMGHGFSAAVFSLTLHRFLSPDEGSGSLLKRPRESNAAHPNRRVSDQMPQIVSPSEVLKELNSKFYFENNNQPFFTILYGVINTNTGLSRIARAGHPYPILHKKDGTLIHLESEGVAIGVFPKIEVNEKQFLFEKSDRLYLYSDGLIETANRTLDRFSDERLVSSLKKYRSMSLYDTVQALDCELNEWKTNRKFDDDIAFMAIERW